MTEYLRDHPGGRDALLEVAGTDATSAYEDVGHSEDAREILQGLLIGRLEGAPKEETGPSKPTTPPASQIVHRHSVNEAKDTTSKLITPRTELAVATVAAVGLAWAVNNYASLPTLHISSSSSKSIAGTFTQGLLSPVLFLEF